MTEPKAPLVVLVESLFFAPIGAAVLLREQLPKLAEVGRTRVESRVRLARMVGEFAVKAATKEVERRLAGRDTPSAAPTPPSATTTASAPTPSTTGANGRPQFDLDRPPPAVTDLPIPGYNSLAASQVVELLRSLDPAELEVVRRYETAGRHRRTILNRIDQLVA